MYRSDIIYLSKFELDPDPEYLDLDEFDLDCGQYSDEFDDEITPRNEKRSLMKIRVSGQMKSKQLAMPDMDEDMY
jgi:hypothetical protein